MIGLCVKHDGQGGIRTHETLAGLPVFKTGAFNHSATCPCVAPCAPARREGSESIELRGEPADPLASHYFFAAPFAPGLLNVSVGAAGSGAPAGGRSCVRAVSPGHYTLPQAKVEDMYRPDRFARTATGVIDVTGK